jgi:AcrR family transcriptional regulator
MSFVDAVRPKAGRPLAIPSQERRRQIIAAAGSAFLECGYSDTTVDEIAARCGMSKKTVYKHFADKTELFEALIRSMPLAPDLPLTEMSEGIDVENVLALALLHVGQFIMTEPQLSVMHLAISESRKHPEISNLFFDICIERGRQQFAGLVSKLQSSGSLTGACDANTLADILLGATIKTAHFDLLIYSRNAGTDANIEVMANLESMIRQRLHILLRGIAMAKSPDQ